MCQEGVWKDRMQDEEPRKVCFPEGKGADECQGVCTGKGWKAKEFGWDLYEKGKGDGAAQGRP